MSLNVDTHARCLQGPQALLACHLPYLTAAMRPQPVPAASMPSARGLRGLGLGVSHPNSMVKFTLLACERLPRVSQCVRAAGSLRRYGSLQPLDLQAAACVGRDVHAAHAGIGHNVCQRRARRHVH